MSDSTSATLPVRPGTLPSPSIGEMALRGRLIVITGPSGVGKGTLLRQLRKCHPDLQFSVSATTRQPRPGEQDGVHYHFYTREQFVELCEAHQFLEWAEYAGNYYGTPLQPVLEKLRAGNDVLLEIELDGARQVMQAMPQALRVFIAPPDLHELERRLRDRNQDDENSIARRLDRARLELSAAAEYDVVVTNDSLDEALGELEAVLYDSQSAAVVGSAVND